MAEESGMPFCCFVRAVVIGVFCIAPPQPLPGCCEPQRTQRNTEESGIPLSCFVSFVVNGVFCIAPPQPISAHPRKSAVRVSSIYHTKTMPTLRCDPQALLIDADDTLWENNIYFEQTIAEVMHQLNHKEMSPKEVRLFLNQVERETILERGYGSHSIFPFIVETLSTPAPPPVAPRMRQVTWGVVRTGV